MSNILIVDNDLQKIIIPSTVKQLGVVSDDGVKYLKFRLPRYCDEADLSQFTIRINYENAAKGPDSSLARDKVVGDEFIEFRWRISRYATAFKGDVKFNVCCKKIEGVGANAVVLQEFNTQPAFLPVLEGLETTERVIDVYPDLVQLWQEELFGRFNGRIDSSLTIEGQAADAKIVGDKLKELEKEIQNIKATMGWPDLTQVTEE